MLFRLYRITFYLIYHVSSSVLGNAEILGLQNKNVMNIFLSLNKYSDEFVGGWEYQKNYCFRHRFSFGTRKNA